MNRRIFDMGLPVETVSTYILCCTLMDQGRSISTKNLIEIWTGTEEELKEGLDNLEKKEIIAKRLADNSGAVIYRLTDTEWWHGAHRIP